MIIDLNEEEREFLQRMIMRVVVLAELQDDLTAPNRTSDYVKAKKLLNKFVEKKE